MVNFQQRKQIVLRNIIASKKDLNRFYLTKTKLILKNTIVRIFETPLFSSSENDVIFHFFSWILKSYDFISTVDLYITISN